jgi:type II secretory pathway component PulF
MMPSFSYVCVDDNGIELRGVAAAETEDQLADRLRRQGQYLVRSTMAPDGRVSLAEVRLFERITRRDVVVFTQQLATLTATGISLIEGLQDIESQLTKETMKRVVAAVRRDIESGDPLSASLARHPAVFGDLYVNVVRGGEATGKIDQALDDLVAQLEWQAELNSRIREVATYPALVVLMLGVLSIVLVGYTIPRFLQVYERLNAQIELPLPTRIVMSTSAFMRLYWPVMVSGLVTVAVSLRLWGQTDHGAVWLSRASLQIPVVGELRRKIALSRFARYFASLHSAGLEMAPSLSLVGRLIGNAHLSQRLGQAVQRVMAGESLSRALKTVGEFPPIVIQMLALGERTGRMAKSLDDVRRYFDREVDQTITRALTFFGPIMLVLLAGTFVVMALAFYLPLFQLLQGIR